MWVDQDGMMLCKWKHRYTQERGNDTEPSNPQQLLDNFFHLFSRASYSNSRNVSLMYSPPLRRPPQRSSTASRMSNCAPGSPVLQLLDWPHHGYESADSCRASLLRIAENHQIKQKWLVPASVRCLVSQYLLTTFVLGTRPGTMLHEPEPPEPTLPLAFWRSLFRRSVLQSIKNCSVYFDLFFFYELWHSCCQIKIKKHPWISHSCYRLFDNLLQILYRAQT